MKLREQIIGSILLAGCALLIIFTGSRVLAAPIKLQNTSQIAPPATTPVPNEIIFNGATPTPSITNSLDRTLPITTTSVVTATGTLTATTTTEPSPTPTSTPTPAPAYLPMVSRQIFSTPETLYYCSNPGVPIPDDNPGGVSVPVVINDPRIVLDIDVKLDIFHPFVGDLSASLTHAETGRTVTLFDRPGRPASSDGCKMPNVRSILDDEVSLPVENQCADTSASYSPAAIAGIFLPTQPLNVLDGEPVNGNWILNVSDQAMGDSGSLQSWCLAATLGSASQIPTPPPPSPALPARALIRNISGQPQALPLDCESRVAVDWAAFFGVYIDEFAFFNNLPVSDNPDAGFVGNVNGAWGQIPPRAYGVHAEPVAALLRAYGVNAYAHRPLSWDALRAEIAAGRPVYVFTVGGANLNQVPVYYTASDGHLSIVARYEHTVMVIGYTETSVTIMDGGSISTRSIPQFLSSWSALNNMAITAKP